MILGLTSGTFMFFYYQMCRGLTRFAARAAASSKPFRKHAASSCPRQLRSSPNACLRRSAAGCPPRPRRGGCLPDTRAGETLRAAGPCFSLNPRRISNTLSSASIHLRALANFSAWVAELVDARDLKSLGTMSRAGSIPALGTNKIKGLAVLAFLLVFWEKGRLCPVLCPYAIRGMRAAFPLPVADLFRRRCCSARRRCGSCGPKSSWPLSPARRRVPCCAPLFCASHGIADARGLPSCRRISRPP